MSVTPDDGRTHWHGCEREHGHHACALAELARLRDCRDRWKSMCQQAWNERDDTYDSLEYAEAELARLRAELADLKLALAEARGETYDAPRAGWQCFHCGEWFRTKESAESHFGITPECLPKLRAELERVSAERDNLRTLMTEAVDTFHGRTVLFSGRFLSALAQEPPA